MEQPPKQIAHLIKSYADLPTGTAGDVVKIWTDPTGCQWVRLHFGKNSSGQKMSKAVPRNCLHFQTLEIINWLLARFTPSELEDITDCLSDSINEPASSFES